MVIKIIDRKCPFNNPCDACMYFCFSHNEPRGNVVLACYDCTWQAQRDCNVCADCSDCDYYCVVQRDLFGRELMGCALSYGTIYRPSNLLDYTK